MSAGSIFLLGICLLYLLSRLRDWKAPPMHIDDAWQHRRYLRRNGDPRTWRLP